MPSFAEWQAQQGGGAPPAVPTSGGSFAEWQAAQGGGGPGAAAPPPTAPAPYDWLQAYDAAQANTYGEESSQQMIQNIMTGADTSADYQKAVDAGIITARGGPVDWSKAPKPVSSPDGNFMANSVGGRYGFVNPYSKQPTASVTGEYIDDPNYGKQAVVQKRAANSPEMNALRAGAFSMAAMPIGLMLAPAIAGATGLSQTTSSLLANAAVGAGKTALQGGKVDPITLAGGVAGGMTGIPFGSTLGSMGAGMLEGKKPNITPAGAGMTFASWLASQAANGR